jgi:hypothetical protein
MAIARLDDVVGWVRQKIEERYGPSGEETYELFVHVYGRNGVLGEREPTPISYHEVGILIEAVAPSREQAIEIAALAQRNVFFARFPGARGTAGVAAIPFDEVLPARTGYIWTINHLLPLEDPLELFPIRVIEVGTPVGEGRR